MNRHENHPDQELLLMALWTALEACRRLQAALEDHDCDPGSDDECCVCRSCCLYDDAAGMPYVLEGFESAVSGEVCGLNDVLERWRQALPAFEHAVVPTVPLTVNSAG